MVRMWREGKARRLTMMPFRIDFDGDLRDLGDYLDWPVLPVAPSISHI